MTRFLTFSYNATILSNSARRAVGLLRFKLKHLKQCGWSTYTKLFSSYIGPILYYCAEVWGLKPYEEVEGVQLNACDTSLEYINLLRMILFWVSQTGLVVVGATSWQH